MKKYNNITELMDAFGSGELDDGYYVMLDKGGQEIHLRQKGPPETDDDRYEKCRAMFNPRQPTATTELLEYLGVPFEWA